MKLYYHLGMKQFFKSTIFMVSVAMALWLGMETLFYSIATDAQRAYEQNLLAQAQFYYKDLEKTRNASFKLGGVYVHEEKLKGKLELKNLQTAILDTEAGRLVELSPAITTHLLSRSLGENFLYYALVSKRPSNPKNKAEGFYAEALTEAMKTKSFTPLYKIDTEQKRLRYIQPLYVSRECLECHSSQGLVEGELYGGGVVDMDATFIIDRTEKIWYNFFFVTFLTTLFVGMMLFIILMISRQKFRYFAQNILLEEQLQAKVNKLNQVLKASQTGYWEWNIVTGEHNVDAQWLKIIGLDENGITHTQSDWQERIHPDDLNRVGTVVQSAIAEQRSYVVEFRMRHAEGHYVWIQGSGGITQRGKDGEVIKLSGTHQDITQRKLLELDRQKSTVYLSTLFEKNPNIIIVSNGKEIIKVNDAFLSFFSEYDSLEAFKEEHHCISDFFVSQDSGEFISNSGGNWMDEVLLSSEPVVKIGYKQQEYCFSVYAKKVYEQEQVSIIVTLSNITEMYRLKKSFERLSIVDELTKVHNRRHFNKVFLSEINRSVREQHTFCLAILDIDNFKRYNDHYGHDAGDDVLVRFADTVSKIAKRSNEFFFRLGGEEFGLIFSNKTVEEARHYGEMIVQSIEALEIEHEENLPWKRFTISIGIAFVEADQEHNLKEIYKEADEALYRAKENGRNRIEMTLH